MKAAPQGRHELKHTVNQADLIQLRQRLPHIAQRDKHAEEGAGYRVRSLYFDNYADKVLREKLEGVDHREKFRIRFYNADLSFLRLEKKSKHRGLCFKESTPICVEESIALLKGDYDPMRYSDRPLLAELCAKMRFQQLRPRNIVDYEREAFVYAPGNVRITLDHDIRSSDYVGHFFDEQLCAAPLSKAAVLEVKYDHFLPELIRGMVALSSRQSTPFSKYAACRMQ